jgi:hypothetical protein
MILKKIFSFDQKNPHFLRYLNYLEFFVLGALLVLTVAQLNVLLGINIWRQDSMYYVNFYDDKLISEGRWINYALFPLLKIIPAPICILLSYSCLSYFVYAACQRLVDNWRYSLALALLVLNVPVLTVQLEWPETLLFAFLMLPLAVIESKKIPDYIFFPVFAILFFGSFSAFYFLLPLLFLNSLNFYGFIRLMVVWSASFVVGYFCTNQIVHALSGHYIEVADWRHPHPIKNFNDLLHNIQLCKTYFSKHMLQFYSLIGVVSFYGVVVFSLSKCRSLNSVLGILVGFFCALGIYVTAIPLGIVVQERTSLSFWVAMIIAVLAVKNIGTYHRFFGLALILMLGFFIGNANYLSVKSYSDVTNMLAAQIKKAVPYEPAEVHNLFLVVNSNDALSLFRKIEYNIRYKSYFSEPMWGPMNWVSSFKSLGYNNIIVCVDEENGWCRNAAIHYKEVDVAQPNSNIFVSYRVGDDVIVSINKTMLLETENLLKD